MEGLKIVLTVILILVCMALTVIVLLQEGKSAGLGAISGAAETYWGKNKGRSMEGKLEKFTKYLVIAFLGLAIVLNIPFAESNASDNAEITTTSTPAVEATSTPTEDVTTDDGATNDETVEDDATQNEDTDSES